MRLSPSIDSELRCFFAVALCVLMACSSSESDDVTSRADMSGEKGEKDAGKADAGGKKPDAGATAQKDAGAASAQRDAATVSPSSALNLPADVCKVLQNDGCLTCHKDPPVNNAPMPLLTAAHFAAKAVDGSALADTVLKRVRDAQRPMPPLSSGLPTIDDADLATLKAWIDGGARGVDGPACDPSATATAVGPMPTPDWAKQGWPGDACEQVITLGAHGNYAPLAQDPTGYPIAAAQTDYHCFYEQVPYNKPMQAIALRVRIESADDMELVHHLVVSGQEAGDNSLDGAKPNFNGDHKHCDNPTGSTLAVWAPGAQNPISTPSDVGILLPAPSSYFELQIHYNNPQSKAGKQSRVQYDICLTSKARPQTAGTFWLGFENANVQTITGTEFLVPLDNKGNGKAVGQCSAKNKGRILSIMPHMHEHGMHARMQIKHANGSTDTLIDTPFSFMDQASFFWDNLWVDSGDTMVSTCEWDKSPVNFGFASTQEMCFFYTLAYPLETFKANALLGERGIVGGNLACAGASGPN